MKVLFTLLLFTCIVVSCGIYGNPSDAFIQVLTVSVGNFKNIPQTSDPQINYRIREKLENKFRQDYHWRVVDNTGGLDIQGAITDYKIEPIVIDSKGIAIKNRITLTVSYQTNSTYNCKGIAYNRLAVFVDYDAAKNLGTIGDSLHNLLVNDMVEHLFKQCNLDW